MPVPGLFLLFASTVAIIFCDDHDYDSVACRGQGSEIGLGLYEERETPFNFRSFWAEVNRTMLLQTPESSSSDVIVVRVDTGTLEIDGPETPKSRNG